MFEDAKYEVYMSEASEKVATAIPHTKKGFFSDKTSYTFPENSRFNGQNITEKDFKSLQKEAKKDSAKLQEIENTYKTNLREANLNENDFKIEFDKSKNLIKINEEYQKINDTPALGGLKFHITNLDRFKGNKTPKVSMFDAFEKSYAAHGKAETLAEQRNISAEEAKEKLGPNFKYPEIHNIEIKEGSKPKDVIKNALDNSPGIAFSEHHGNPKDFNFIKANMNEFKNNGVTKIFVEHFRDDLVGNVLHDFYKGNIDKQKMNSLLPSVGNKNEIVDMIVTAREQGIEVVAMGHTLDMKNGDMKNHNGDGKLAQLDERLYRFNNIASKIVNEKADGGKFITIAGENHNNTAISESGDKSVHVPGLSQILKIPVLTVNGQGNLEQQHENLLNRPAVKEVNGKTLLQENTKSDSPMASLDQATGRYNAVSASAFEAIAASAKAKHDEKKAPLAQLMKHVPEENNEILITPNVALKQGVSRTK